MIARISVAELLVCGFLGCWCAAPTVAHADDDRPVDFASEIQPLLAEKCIHCHGVDTSEGGLRLHRREAALRELDSGRRAIVPGSPQASELLRRVRASDEERMPPEGDPLTNQQIAQLTHWIEQGAAWQVHWSYRPLDESGCDPQYTSHAWARNQIDRYIIQALDQRGLAPSPSATRATLIKRLSYDLLGLPPKPSEVDRFVHDPSPRAYQTLVDSLLASPHFGERWGRHWLDKARYADSDGYEKDRPRPDAWRYRDWVIEAINSDKSIRQFTIEQIAGDLLPNATPEQHLATAFHRQTLTNTEGGTDPEQWRVAAVMDRTETVGTIWMGLTVGCARCHSHKYDQLTQTEYYQLFAFFNNADETNYDMPKPQSQRRLARIERRVYDQRVRDVQQKLRELETSIGIDRATWESRVDRSELPAVIRQILDSPPAKRIESDQKKLDDAYAKAAQPLVEARKQLKDLQQKGPPAETMAVRVVRQRTDDHRMTHLLRRGDFQQPEQRVAPATFSVLPPLNVGERQPSRLDLARWLVDERNALVARVVANHVWQHLFGSGLVSTPADFGVRGEPPVHPRLLDHLALQYMRFGWSRKNLIRYIVNSSTYQQTSSHRPEVERADPQNRLLHRQNRYRVEAEILRDLALSVSGLLDRRVGGQSVFPPMPAEVAAISYANNFRWSTSVGGERYRRGMYTFFKRTAPHPTLMTFDCPDANVTNVRRNRSNTPLGALTLLNNRVFTEAAAAFARRIGESTGNDRDRIHQALRCCLVRDPTAAEVSTLEKLLAKSRNYYTEHVDEARRLIGAESMEPSCAAELAAWTAMLRVVLNLDEFISRE